VIQLSFHGAAGSVTGSRYLLQSNGSKILIDAGMFQGPGELRQLNWDPPPFDPASLSAVVLTHTHIDHIGYLPRLVKAGFRGPVYTSAPTADLAAIALMDAAKLQEEDADYRNRKGLTRHAEALPLYTEDDVREALDLIKPIPFNSWTSVADNLRFQLHVVGHVLGAACVEVQADDNGRKVSVLFSGDVGRYSNPLTINPAEPPETDYLVCESTYGGRLHDPEDPRDSFTKLINEAFAQKSVLLIPAFAVSRTQEIIYVINELIRLGIVPPIEIHVDSPMSVSATDIYCKYHAYHRVDLERIGGPGCVLAGKHVHLHRKRKSSKLLNKLKGPAIILSASGMLAGGRVLHHLLNRLDDPNTTVVLTGYMAEGTLGRKLADGATEVRVLKQPMQVRARVVNMRGISGHADYNELLYWLRPIRQAPKRVFVTHGEKPQSEAMAGHLRSERGWECHLPVLNETVEL
jgi:metallo-beta-lactamase family protein